MTVIYADILIAVNLVIDFIMLLSTSRLVSIKPKRIRLILGSVFASLLSLLILADANTVLLFAAKIAGLMAAVLITFGFKTPAAFIKTVFVFLAVNFVFTGIVTVIWFLISPAGMIVKNGMVYFNISPILLVLFAAGSYLVMTFIEYILKKRQKPEEIYTVKIVIDSKTIELNALYDTGNNIVDAISGHPVTVCELERICEILPYEDVVAISEFVCKGSELNSEFLIKKKLKLVPYHVINSSGIMVCIEPDSIEVKINGEFKKINSEIGMTPCRLSQGEFQAILNSRCL